MVKVNDGDDPIVDDLEEIEMFEDLHQEKSSLSEFSTVENLMAKNRSVTAPIRSDFFRISDNKALIIKLWPARMIGSNSGRPLLSQIEIEEVHFNPDGTRSFGPRIRLPATYNSLMLAFYLNDFLLQARKLEKQLREELNREGIEWRELEWDDE